MCVLASPFARTSSSHHLSEDYPDQSPFNYTINNPILFIDPDGKEPIIPRVMGLQAYIKLVAENTLASTHQELNWWHSSKLKKGYSQAHNETRNLRYLYSERWGWIDMKHFAAAAMMSAVPGVGTTGALQFGESKEWGQENSASGHSSWDYEDLPSNLLGAYFTVWYAEKIKEQTDPHSEFNPSYLEYLSMYLIEIGVVTDAEEAVRIAKEQGILDDHYPDKLPAENYSYLPNTDYTGGENKLKSDGIDAKILKFLQEYLNSQDNTDENRRNQFVCEEDDDCE